MDTLEELQIKFQDKMDKQDHQGPISREKRIQRRNPEVQRIVNCICKTDCELASAYTTMLSNPINPTLPETNRLQQSETIVFQPSLGCKLLLSVCARIVSPCAGFSQVEKYETF